MQCQRPCVASSQPSPSPQLSHAQPVVTSQTPVVAPHNSFHRFLNVLSIDHARKAEELVENQAAFLNAQEKKAFQTARGLQPEPEVEHSRSRDKLRRLPKSKNSKKQGKKGKQPAQQLSTQLVIDVAMNEIPSVCTPVFSVQAANQQINEPACWGIAVVQDFAGILPPQQYQCGEIIDNHIKNEKVVTTFIAQTEQQSAHLQKDQLSAYQLPVSQMLPVIIQQKAEKEDEQEKRTYIQSKKNCEDNAEQSKEKVNQQHQQIDFNDRLQRKSHYLPEERQWNYKSKMCYEFIKGRCKRQVNQCSYAHGYEDIKPERRMRYICRNYIKGFCKKPQEQCRYYHQKPRDRDYRDYSPNSEHSSLSDEHKRRLNKMDVSVIKEEKKEDRKEEKKEMSNQQREFEQKRDERRDGKKEEKRQQRRQQKRDERKEDKKDSRREDKKERKQDRKHSRLSQQRVQDKKIDKATQKKPQTKKHGQTFQNPNNPENSPNFIPPFPYFSYMSGYFAPNQHPQNQSWSSRSQQLPNAQQNNMHYGYSSFCAPMFFPNAFPHQKTAYAPAQYPNSNFNLQNQQFNRANMPNYQLPPNYPQNYQIYSAPPAYFQQFYPCFVPPQSQNFQQTPHNVSNDSLSPPNSDCEHPLNSTMQDKRQRQKREQKGNSSKDRSRDRKQKKQHRR